MTIFKSRTLSLALALSLTLPFAAAQEQEGNIASHTDVPYVADGSKAHLLDLYLPEKAEKPSPVVVFIHGGGWMTGHKGSAGLSKVSGLHRLMKSLREQGYAVAALNYRLSGEAPFPAQLEDVQTALQWIADNAKEYHLDSSRIALTGDSAGSHLAQLAAVKQQGDSIRAVLSFYGVSDIGNVNAERLAKNCPETIQQLMGKLMDNPPDNTPEGLLLNEPFHSVAFFQKAIDASPIYFVSGKTPPMQLVHGDDDCWVPHVQSVKMHDALKQAGVDSELVILEGIGHAATRFYDEDINAKTLEFLNKHME